MPKTKVQKKESLEKLGQIIKDSLTVTFVNFHGLSANDTSALRKGLSSAEVGFFVSKKKLAKKALAEAKVSGETPELPGEFAVAFGKDQIAPAREVFVFQKKFDGKVSIVGGIFEGAFVAKEKMLAIAEIPGRKVLEGQFVNLINSPLQGFVMALSEIAKKKTA